MCQERTTRLHKVAHPLLVGELQQQSLAGRYLSHITLGHSFIISSLYFSKVALNASIFGFLLLLDKTSELAEKRRNADVQKTACLLTKTFPTRQCHGRRTPPHQLYPGITHLLLQLTELQDPGLQLTELPDPGLL